MHAMPPAAEVDLKRVLAIPPEAAAVATWTDDDTPATLHLRRPRPRHRRLRAGPERPRALPAAQCGRVHGAPRTRPRRLQRVHRPPAGPLAKLQKLNLSSTSLAGPFLGLGLSSRHARPRRARARRQPVLRADGRVPRGGDEADQPHRAVHVGGVIPPGIGDRPRALRQHPPRRDHQPQSAGALQQLPPRRAPRGFGNSHGSPVTRRVREQAHLQTGRAPVAHAASLPSALLQRLHGARGPRIRGVQGAGERKKKYLL
jgi:hypothetical protein